MTLSISRSSIAASAAALISPFARFSRAAFNAGGRNRLPTWSARKGGFFRCIDLAPIGRQRSRRADQRHPPQQVGLARLADHILRNPGRPGVAAGGAETAITERARRVTRPKAAANPPY